MKTEVLFYSDALEKYPDMWPMTDMNWGWVLIVDWEDGSPLRIESDGGEPEDQLLVRDWRWVKPLIEEAYLKGIEYANRSK